ncbi:MAG: molybdopterin cofactor-binding domain-containing protein, partial [Vicinamibacterales bacterium]
MKDPEYEIEPERYELSEPQRYLFELPRRDFLRVVGAGLVVVVARPGAASRQESGRSGQGRADSDIAAWLHIDERGRVTAYTGKVEIGQNIRTSLAQAVADELRLPIEAITMVMADTELTPDDAGTFGSQSTPRMSRQLSRAAATAREMLIDQAAARWQIDRHTLSVSDGRILAGGRSLTYGGLTRGQKLTGVVAADPAVTPADAWTVRGKAAGKVNGRLFVTGRHEFVPDIVRPGMLHGRIVRPDSIGASFVSLDDSRARAMPGVTMVRDGDFRGVVAPDRRTADRAMLAIRAEWRASENQPSSTTIYEHLKKTTRVGGGGRGSTPFSVGDVARAREGARTFDASYRIPY